MASRNHLYFVQSYVVNYNEGDTSLQRTTIAFTVDPGDQFHIVVDDDTITELAYRYYGDPQLWYAIADANLIDNPLELTGGESLLIPAIKQLNN